MGLTNRLLAGRARRVCLAFPIPGREGERYRRHRPPGAARVADRAGGPRRAGHRPGRALRARVRRLARRPLAQPRGGRGVRRRALPRAARRRPARLPGPAGARARTTTCATTCAVRPGAGGRRPRGRPRRRLDLRARAVRAARRARAVPARDRRPPDRQRALDGGGRRGGRAGRRRADARAAARRRRRDRCSTRRGCARWPRPRRAWRGPTRRATSRARCSTAAGPTA